MLMFCTLLTSTISQTTLQEHQQILQQMVHAVRAISKLKGKHLAHPKNAINKHWQPGRYKKKTRTYKLAATSPADISVVMPALHHAYS